MWKFDHDSVYKLIGRFKMPFVFTYGNRDREKRERIREEAAKVFPDVPPDVKQWAFRIHVQKAGNSPFDIDNVPKLIIDAFCGEQIDEDKSASKLRFYPKDTIDYVTMVQVAGGRVIHEELESTVVEVYGR